jgi:hypothetical protein
MGNGAMSSSIGRVYVHRFYTGSALNKKLYRITPFTRANMLQTNLQIFHVRVQSERAKKICCHNIVEKTQRELANPHTLLDPLKKLVGCFNKPFKPTIVELQCCNRCYVLLQVTVESGNRDMHRYQPNGVNGGRGVRPDGFQ